MCRARPGISGRNRTPTAAVVDSSSVKASPVTGPRGFDGAKKIDGIKRHILVDTGGLLLSVEVTAADTQDRTILAGLITSAKKHSPNLTKIWADKDYQGPTTRELAATTGIDIDIVSGPKDQTGFKVQPRRWVVERTHAWINQTPISTDSYANGKPPSKHTPDSSSPAKSLSYSRGSPPTYATGFSSMFSTFALIGSAAKPRLRISGTGTKIKLGHCGLDLG